ncbi:MAG TPA: hypothetical protein VFC99_13265 [Acidimicrobiia bacterium]|nr:hypothetical protein [Acidimicrobiia bacterium]
MGGALRRSIGASRRGRRLGFGALAVLTATVLAGCLPPTPPPPPAPKLAVTPGSADLYSDFTQNDDDLQVVTVTNQGGSTTGPLSVEPSPGKTYGTWDVTHDGCTNVRLDPGTSCTFEVDFSADVWFGFDDSRFYTIGDHGTSLNQQVTFSGHGHPSVLWFYGAGGAVQDVPVIERSAAAGGPTSLYLTLYNPAPLGANPITPTNVSIDPLPGNVGTFSLGTEHCSNVVVTGGNQCTIEVRYDNATGAGEAGVILSVDWADGATALPVIGEGTP